jgi:tripartite-type tricarboxylate transporter receptor subunit TctC
MIITRRSLVAGAAALVAAPAIVRAQTTWPSTTVKLAVPFSAGSTTDLLARAISRSNWPRSGASR